MKAEDRRRHPRKTVQDRAVIHRQAPPPLATLYCTTVDISASGLRLKLKQALDAGEPIEIVVHVPNQSGSFRLRAKTRWSAPLSVDKSFHLGVEIVDGPDTDYGAWQDLFV